MRRILRRVTAAIAWTRALDACARKDPAKAYDLLQSIYRLFGCSFPSERMVNDVNLLVGYVALRLENYDLALDATRIALRQIAKSTRLNSDEKDYLTFYGDIIIDRCLFLIEDCPALKSRSRRDSSCLNRRNVRSYLKRNFPISSSASELKKNRSMRCSLLRERCPHCGACGIRRLFKPLSAFPRCTHCAKPAKTSAVANSFLWGVGPPLLIPIAIAGLVGEMTSWIFLASISTLIGLVAIAFYAPVSTRRR